MWASLIRDRWPHALILGAAFAAVLFSGDVVGRMVALRAILLAGFDRWILWGASAVLLGCALVAAIPATGRLRLGGADARPEFSSVSWFAMLFAAGIGSGLMYWGAAEPLTHAASPPDPMLAPFSAAARQEAMSLTLFHWTLHAWAIYAAAALAIGFFAYRGPASLSPSAPWRRVLPAPGRRALDAAAALAVVFGVTASLGQGVYQLTAGVERLSGWRGAWIDPMVLGALVGAYLFSALGGIARGIRPLSNLNVAAALGLLAFVAWTGLDAGAWRAALTDLADFAGNFVRHAVELRPKGPERLWTHEWTLTYLLWWVAWTPFVGVFIARISYGRSIRELIAAVVIAPSIMSWLWFSIFGMAAFEAETLAATFDAADLEQSASVIYRLLEQLPFARITQAIALTLIFLFLVTSADSGTYVLAMFAKSGNAQPTSRERAFWALALGALTFAAVTSGYGQDATRAYAVLGAAPMALLLAAQIGAFVHALVRRSSPDASASERPVQ